MNIENKPLQQRISELQQAQQPKVIAKQPIETGLSSQTFEQRKAVFEKQTPPVQPKENLLSETMETELEEALNTSHPTSLQQRGEQLKGVVPQSSELGSTQPSGYLIQRGSDGYDHMIHEHESEESSDSGSKYLKESSQDGYHNNDLGSPNQSKYLVEEHESEESSDSGSKFQLKRGSDGYDHLVQEQESEESSGSKYLSKKSDEGYSYKVQENEPEPSNPKPVQRQPHGLEPLDPNSQEYGPEARSKYSHTTENLHQIQERGKSNVEGIQRGFEFDLVGTAKYTAMFSSKESQAENQLNFTKEGVKRGSSEELLSTQSPNKGLWGGSKPDRMLFVLSPQGEIYAIDPKKPIQQKGATVLDVRIHHSSLLDGKEVAGAGEIQVSAGLAPAEIERLQKIVLERVTKKLQGEKDIKPEVLQKLISRTVDEEMGKLLKNHQPGQIEVISDRSGHYQPDLQMTGQVIDELESRGVKIEKVNVELGDKTGKHTNLEGELMVPAITVQASKGVKDGEAQLRGVNARKLNMQQELLSKVSQDPESLKASQQKQTEQLTKLGKRLNELLSAGKFPEAAIIYERIALLKGVKVEATGKQLSLSQTRQQEQQILEVLKHDNSFAKSPNNLKKLISAYEEVLKTRHEKPQVEELPSVEQEHEEHPQQSIKVDMTNYSDISLNPLRNQSSHLDLTNYDDLSLKQPGKHEGHEQESQESESIHYFDHAYQETGKQEKVKSQPRQVEQEQQESEHQSETPDISKYLNNTGSYD